MYGWAHSSVWIEWLPAEQLVEGSNPSGPVVKYMHLYREWITHMDGKAQSPVVVWKIYFH